jgi:hypothetical protein
MENNVIYIGGSRINERKELEDRLIRAIDEEAGVFFQSCSKAAHAFSVMIAKDCGSWSKDAFEEMVVSPEELNSLIQRINRRICREFNLNETDTDEIGAWNEPGIRFEAAMGGHLAIGIRIREHKTSDRITAVSERVIGDAFSLILGGAFSSNLIDFIFSRMKIGEKLLGENSRQNRAGQFQKEIYSHIEGSLINLKAMLKNELTAKWIRQIGGEEADIPEVV